jgi:hexosaminidase
VLLAHRGVLFVAVLSMVFGPHWGCARSSDATRRPDPVADGGAHVSPTASGVTVSWTADGSLRRRDAYRYILAVTNHRAEPLDQGWRLFFTSSSGPELEGAAPGEPVAEGDAGPASNPQGLRCSHGDGRGSGDYFVLEPLANFVAIKSGETRAVRMLVSNGSIQKTEAPAAFHLVLPGQATPIAVHASTTYDARDARLRMREPGDLLPLESARERFEENASLAARPVDVRRSLLPTPMSVKETGGRFVLDAADTEIAFAPGLESEAAYLRAALSDVLSGTLRVTDAGPGHGNVSLALEPTLTVSGRRQPDPEAYALVVDGKGVSIKGADASGVLHGIETLRQLIPLDAYRLATARDHRPGSLVLPTVEIQDAPLFAYRGMHLDVARHFQSKDMIKKLLDLLAAHKLNKLHFHLSDDEGWRLQIPGLPELTDYGARRGFDPGEARMLHPGLGSTASLDGSDGIAGKAADDTVANGGIAPAYQGFEEASLNFVGQGSGYYSTTDFIEILVYARERHIDVVPEFDMPAHGRAAAQSMERRYDVYRTTDPAAASRYRLLDPEDRTAHTSVQGYVDNLMNPCIESTYAFVEKVEAEVQAMFTAAHTRLVMIHVGGDEPPGARWWSDSPACRRNPQTKDLDDHGTKNYFFGRLQRIVSGLGATMTGWDDVVADGGSPLPGFVTMPWSNVWGEGGEDRAYRAANGGRQVILAHATNLYMDLAYEKDPDEPGSDWGGFVDEQRTFEYLPFDVFSIATRNRLGNPIAPAKWAKMTRLTPQGRANIVGLEGLLWSENVKSPELLEYMAFPKILGVAERAWNRDMPTAETLGRAWQDFVNTLGQAELPRLDSFRPVDVRGELSPRRSVGVNYRIPPPGAILDHDQQGTTLRANVRYPGMAIEVSTDRGATWTRYQSPAPASPSVLVRTKTADGRTSRASAVE